MKVKFSDFSFWGKLLIVYGFIRLGIDVLAFLAGFLIGVSGY